MLIDWFTVGAQALNFLILVWLMKRYLYQPILQAIDAREKKISSELADADVKKVQAQKERDEFERKNAEFDQQRAALLSKATDEANTERQRLVEQARQAADAMRAKQVDALNREQQNLAREITRRTREEVFAIARKTLGDLAETTLEERIGEVFIRRVRTINGDAWEALASALKTSSSRAIIRSTFELPAPQRGAIQQALNETFSADIPLDFETAPEVISGIELTANGQKLAWSIADYLASLQKSVGELLNAQSKSDTKTEATPEAGPTTVPPPVAKPIAENAK